MSLKDRNDVRHTISIVKDTTRGASGGVKGKKGLGADVHSRDVESFEPANIFNENKA
jgi:hypothetical protein